MSPGRTCPKCKTDLKPTFEDTKHPDGWVRHGGAANWEVSSRPPEKGEVQSEVAYRCEPCRKTYRLLDRADSFKHDEHQRGKLS
jgi:hypothetical protein